jgi:Sigma-70 region 3
MTPEDLAVRNATYRRFVELGRAPTVDEVAEETGSPPEEVAAAWRRLHTWWSDRLAPDWQPHTPEGNQAILDGLGLRGEFWRSA